MVGNDQGLREASSGPSHLYYCELSEIEIEKVWDLDFDTDFDFDKAIYMRLPWKLRYRVNAILFKSALFDIYSRVKKYQSLRETRMYKPNCAMKRQFDFDIGYLKKSPCRSCLRRSLIPGCAETCKILDRIQTCLARGISTTHTHSPLEPYAVYLEDWRKR